ncbi:MAG: O-antigen ligase family protein [Leptospirales bacterium]|jgi:O-antigen ligase|nr:O-antigen ligase family protein [Leptospirales bacterium]HNE22392.1 O-antigen ligase family protein [Leptospiraceae bacterium]HNJ04101.1 O-antigen ligase family protein [Leptospiraceae bacterium]HNJ32739.1 O-antigen ligase family protein [Leptospiraceae bacterium]HNL00375.1 O-antigen ligase family protein [Leptospiraceae bacterium]
MQKLFYPLLGLLFVLSTLLSLAFGSLDVSLLREGGAFLVMVVLPFWVYHRRRFKTLADHVFFWASVLTITHSFLNGITYLADTPVPRLKLYLKTFFLASILLWGIAWFRGASRSLLVALCILFSANVLLSWYFLGFTLRSTVLAAYLIGGLVYALEEVETVRLDYRDAAMVLLFGAGLLSTIFSWDRSSAFFGYTHLGLALPLFFLGRHLSKTADVPEFLRNCVFAFSGVMIMFAVFLLVTLYTSGQPLTDKMEKIAGYHVNGLGASIALFLPLCIYVGVNDSNPWVRIWSRSCAIISAGMLLIISSRGSMVGVIISLLLLVIQVRRVRLSGWSARAIVILLIGAGAVVLYFVEPLRQYVQALGSPESMKIRLMIWRLHIANVLHYSPWIGFGPDTFIINAVIPPADPELSGALKPFMRGFGPIVHAHNVFVQLLQDFGLLGILFSVILGVSVAGVAWRFLFGADAPGLRSYLPYGFAALTALFVQGLFDYTLSDPMTYYPAVMILGMILQVAPGKHALEMSLHKITSIVFGAGIVLFVVLFWMGWNRTLYISETSVFRGQTLSDRFGNVTFLGISVFTDEQIRAFQFRDRLLLPGNTDHRIEQLAGEFYFQRFKRQGYTDGLTVARSRFERCLAIHPYSALCAWRLSTIHHELGSKTEEERYLDLASIHDPYKLVIDQ